ncbi:MAG: 1-deoxy-D-xylulose-5-phosphate synthase [Firmicutes bacterium]|nr:1-deoxy-D-xylulose-5-phosphate synthase [Bacillota bacterium]
MNKYLENHQFPQDLKAMDYDELELLTYEIRDFLVESVSKTGGHLASNLGAVELSIALHKVFDSPKDKLIWDVGHQTYVHKILTGRASGFSGLRQLDGMSGFPKSKESPHDIFDTGHSSTSISLGLGMAAARDLNGEDYNVVSIIGDGAMTGGIAFEALNNVSSLNSKMIVILNDNEMSISKNTGGFPKYLSKLRGSGKYVSIKSQIKKNVLKVPVIGEGVVAGMKHARDSIKYAMIDGIMFEELGFKYFGPIDGHDIQELCETLELAKNYHKPVFIHVMTKKGKGYSKAEERPDMFHGIGPFDMDTGLPLKKSSLPSYSKVFGNKLCEMAGKDERVTAVSAAMIDGTGLEGFNKLFPKRMFDVGIAEGHAVTFAAGLAKAGLKPYVAVYSTFFQRAYDQIIEDVCLQELHVTFCIDRAGIVGADGETHHGIFDISYLRHIPNMTIMAPKDGDELEAMLEYSLQLDGPCAIRYPRGSAETIGKTNKIQIGKSHQLKRGTDVEIWSVGTMAKIVLEAADILKSNGISASVINAEFIKPLDKEKLEKSSSKYPLIVTVEDNMVSGGFGESVKEYLKGNDLKVINVGWPDSFIEHGTADELYKKHGMDAKSIAERIIKELER